MNKRYSARVIIWDLDHDCEVTEFSREFNNLKKNTWPTLHNIIFDVCVFLKATFSYLC